MRRLPWVRNHAPLSLVLLAASLSACSALLAASVPVRHPQATEHGYLILSTLQGEVLAVGDEIQTVQGERIQGILTFRFKDGSLDEETTVFTQSPDFHLISDHHIQKGPSFAHFLDQSLDATTGEVVTKSMDKGKEKVETNHLDLPDDVANGLTLALLKNLAPDTPMVKVSMVAGEPKPRTVTLDISPEGEDVFNVGFSRRKATRWDIKVEIGGVAGVVAPLIGKAPKDIHVWIEEGVEPMFLKEEGQSYVGGPIWRTTLVDPTFPAAVSGRGKSGSAKDAESRPAR